jgi:NodT family efflux transporter outer membrane factor (OMF) lipoprotein
MLGPDYRVPTAPLQPAWLEQEDPRLEVTPPVAPDWWKTAFRDPILNQLVETAVEQNLSLRSAGLRVLQAQQNLAIAIGNQYPQQQELTGSAEMVSDNQRNTNPLRRDTFRLYDLGFNLAWEADVWGRFKRQIESASAELGASVADYDGVMVSLIAQIAQNYILIRTFQTRLEVARKNIRIQEESLRIAQAKFDAGAVSALDADQAETLLNDTKATVPALEISLQQLKNSLAVLLGKPPQDMSSLLGQSRPIPTAPREVAIGMPQDLIRRRPDIRVAERRLAAQSAQIGFAVTELYPHFSLGGSIATSSTSIGDDGLFDILDADRVGINLLGAFQWNIFNYGRLKSNVRLQDAAFQQLLVDYQNTVLQAQGEIENAIVAYLKTHEQLLSYGMAADSSQRALDVSTEQYQEGLVDFNTVLTTLRSYLEQQDLLVSTQGDVATGLVQVYKALGGGWEIRGDQDPAQLLPAAMKEEMQERTKYWKGVLQ